MQSIGCHIYHPQRSCGKVMFLHLPRADTPLDRHHRWVHSPPPPGQTHTRPVHAGIHTIPLPSACWDAHALPSVCWDTVNSILLVVVVHAVFICTALGSSVCLNFLFLLKEKMKTGRKGKMSIIFSKWVGLSLPFVCFLLLNKNVYFRLFCGSYLVSRIRFRFHWLEQDCLMYVDFADTGLPRQRENKKFGSSFFQTGKNVIYQKLIKICFYMGNLLQTRGRCYKF